MSKIKKVIPLGENVLIRLDEIAASQIIKLEGRSDKDKEYTFTIMAIGPDVPAVGFKVGDKVLPAIHAAPNPIPGSKDKTGWEIIMNYHSIEARLEMEE